MVANHSRSNASALMSAATRRRWTKSSSYMSPCVERQLVAKGRKSRTRSTLSNSTPTRRRSVAFRRQSAHVASDPATVQLPFDARALMSPAILRPFSCRSTPERSCRQRSCDRSVAVRRQSAHVASDPATVQLPFDARFIMSPAILRPIGRSQSQPVAASRR